MNTFGSKPFEILRGEEDRLIRVDFHHGTDSPRPMAKRIRGRSAIIPGFKSADFFVYKHAGRWYCSESLWGTSIGHGRTAEKAVASAVKTLKYHCPEGESQLGINFRGWPLVGTLPVWIPGPEGQRK